MSPAAQAQSAVDRSMVRLARLGERKAAFDAAKRKLDAIMWWSKNLAWATLIVSVLALWMVDALTVKSLVASGAAALVVRFIGWRVQERHADRALKAIESEFADL